MAHGNDEARETVPLPEPPEYESRYDEDSDVRERYEEQGRYGVMYAGDYKWSDERCTAEAYADAPPHIMTDGTRNPSRNGTMSRRRSLHFHTTWLTVDEATDCIRHIGRYNRFDDTAVANALRSLDAEQTRVVVGREGSPVIYLWTTRPHAVAGRLMSIDAETSDRDVDEDDVFSPGPPDELGAVAGRETFPVGGVGTPIADLETGTPTLLRAWWD